MKPSQKNSAEQSMSLGTKTSAKSPAVTSVLSAEPLKAKSAFESPSAAVWTKYIDSRMKQFGTR